MGQIWEGPLEKIDDFRWKIPKSYKPGMRVPGLIYADEELLKDIRHDRAAEQVANVAFLPGILNYSLAMPDIHWGYGFCLTAGSKILSNFGFYKQIESFERDWSRHNLKNVDISLLKMTQTPISRFIKLGPKEVFKVVTKMGYEIKGTGDHPLFTLFGMKPIKELSLGERVAVFPFEGVPFEEPSNETIISEEDIKKTLLKLGRRPGTPAFEIVLQKLKKRGLLPLTYNHPKLPYVVKIMGFVFGDASMNFIGKRGDGILHFCGKPQDLENVRKDLKNIGYVATPIHFRKQKISQDANKYYDCYSFNVDASSLVVLLETLGVPRGSKVDQSYRVPKWIFETPLWQKRLFLASLFGCELRMPHRRLDRRGYFNAPVFPMAKSERLIKNGKEFLNDISELLKEFGVQTIYIDKRKRHTSTKGKISWALELIFSPKPENLYNLWGKVGFEYNSERAFKANIAVHYLKLKMQILREKEKSIEVTIPQLLRDGLSYQKIAYQLAGNPLTKRFIIDICWKLNKGKKVIPRIPGNFPLFQNYLKEVTEGLGQSGMVWDEIKEIEKIPYQDFVYDFTVLHSDHNFIADNFLVSNCIGGVAATDVEAGGVISPGGVGFDINCLSNSFILNKLGYKRKIEAYEKDFYKRQIICMDFNGNKSDSTEIVGFLKQKPKKPVLLAVTETARQITATSDHPFYTENGMKELGKLKPGDKVAVFPFVGVEYEEPSSEIIVDEEDIKKLFLKLGKSSEGNAAGQILNYLKKKNLLPLKYNSSQLPYLIKIMGYCFGDGSLYFTGKEDRGTVCFWGQKCDLENIKRDLSNIGFKSSIYSRPRHHKIKTLYETVEFDREEIWLRVTSRSFAMLLGALGMPVGNKCRQSYELPKWLFQTPLWQKRLFLAGLFGAELSSPKTMTGHGHNFYCPVLSMNKTAEHLVNGQRFLEDITKLLSEFGISCCKITTRKGHVNKQGLISYCLRLIVSGKTEDLINLYAQIGFEYNQKRTFLGNMAIQYLRRKRCAIEERKDVAVLAPVLYAGKGWRREEIYGYLASQEINERFIERSLYESRNTDPRVGPASLTFEEFIKEATSGLGESGMVWERISHISDIEFDDYVYDFTVKHPHHNFIADNFVVSNCGVRLMRTNLTKDDLPRDRLRKLVEALFSDIPAGVGSKGDIRFNEQEERDLLVKGASYVVGKGYGWQSDLEHTEENGAIKGADPNKVSPRAYERGKRQAGTLGSGNHFLEIQVVDQIYDEEAAKIFGLALDQITVMIHSGSRGLGYQICDDYTQSMIRCLDKYNIKVPDRQLACAPVKSPEGESYLGAMRCAANYAWANRQCLMHLCRRTFERILGKTAKDLGMYLIYDVAHNIAKLEKYTIDGREKVLCVHRKGATRAFPPGHPELPQDYKKVGQPVIIPGDMGRCSYLLVGTEKAQETFYSTCHGSGRVMSRSQAISSLRGRRIDKELEDRGIIVRSTGRDTLSEEASEAYKDVTTVVHAVHGAGISKMVVRMRPIGVIKG